MKKLIRTLVPQGVWSKVRKFQITRDHKRVASLCDSYIEKCFASGERLFEAVPKKDLAGKKIIWQYWAQGFDDELPEVVKVCLESVDKYKGDYELIRLSDQTVSEYVDLPAYMLDRRTDGFTITAFSDVLRLALLYTYGGVWLDATVLLTGPLPEEYARYDFFMFQRDENEQRKKYWENSYAYYWGWGKKYKVRLLNSIIFSKQNSELIGYLLNILLCIWKKEKHYPYYFTTQILFTQLVSGKALSLNCPIASDCSPHYLMQSINDTSFWLTVDEALSSSPIHKLSYKDISVKELKSVLG